MSVESIIVFAGLGSFLFFIAVILFRDSWNKL